MSRHQEVRNLDYQDVLDDFEGYSEGEEELSAEDQALMREGTAQVRSMLGVEAAKISTAQIEEALWHYYYDVDKSVTYLMAKFIAPPPKPVKAAQKPKGMSVISSY
jgi:elongation factor 1 alpha-like protein